MSVYPLHFSEYQIEILRKLGVSGSVAGLFPVSFTVGEIAASLGIKITKQHDEYDFVEKLFREAGYE